MSYFDLIQERDHEGVFFCSDPEVGLKAIIGIHNTTLGPSLGGCRMKSYDSEKDALEDVLKLSRAMSFKSSMAGLNLGGGKSVVILEKPQDKTPELLASFAERINLLKGSYIGACDIGSNTDDLRHMRKHTRWVTGLAEEDGGLGDPSILTAHGVLLGIRAAVAEKLGKEDLEGIRVAVQGAGKVGFLLIELLINAGCQVIVADAYQKTIDRVKEAYSGVTFCSIEELYTKEVDVFSPNAVGGVITPEVVNILKAPVIAGAANNPLSDQQEMSKVLHQKGILYAPDFVINAGGVIMVASEIEGNGYEHAQKKTEAIYDTTLKVFEYAKRHNLPPWEAARSMAMERIESTKATKTGNGSDKEPALC